MEFVNLCQNYDAQKVAAYKAMQESEIKKYLEFVLSLVKDQKIIDKITTNFNNIVVYILDKMSTEVPRNFYGKNSPIKIARAAAFVREQIKNEANGVVFDTVTKGIGLRIQEKNQGAAFHELNHAIAGDPVAIQEEGALYKDGMVVAKLNLAQDKYEALTGNLINESLTDAISYHYYKQNNKRYADDKGNIIPYRTAYDSVRLFSTILLGENLSNQKLLNAYFGSVEDLKLFVQEFDSVVNQPNISFKEILKNSFEYKDNVGSITFSDAQLIRLACIYRANMCKTIEQLEKEEQFIKSVGIDIEEKHIKSIFENVHSQLATESFNL